MEAHCDEAEVALPVVGVEREVDDVADDRPGPLRRLLECRRADA